MNFCVACNTETRNKKFCSNLCQQTARKKSLEDKWLVEHSSYKQLTITIRNRLIDQAGCKCSQCGWGETNPHTGKIPLEIDHIDGNSENNSPENLRVLCPNCHSLTPTYKGANKESKRTYRKKYYAS